MSISSDFDLVNTTLALQYQKNFLEENHILLNKFTSHLTGCLESNKTHQEALKLDA